MSQLSLEPSAPISQHRIRGVASWLAGFRYPGKGGFEQLPKAAQADLLALARETLEALQRLPDLPVGRPPG